MRLQYQIGALLVLSGACNVVLGIDEPNPRAVSANGGVAGSAPGSGGASNGGHAGMTTIEQGGAPVTAGGRAAGVGGVLAAGDAGASVLGGAFGTGGITFASGGEGGGVGVAAGAGGIGGDASEGGASPICLFGERRCGGTGMTPQICDGNSLWVNDPAQSGADCALACREGHCVDCNDEDTRCVNDRAQRCAGGSWDTGELCVNYCQAGKCINPPSCGVSDKCGNHGYSCCKSFYVPGGSFYLSYDEVRYTDQSFRARVDGFLLDKFEVTVERMRRFLEAYEPKVFKPGSGRAAHILDDTGWDELYPLPATATELSVALKCSKTDATWAESANDTQATLPINCADFFVAYAFCIWDGGRLPTEAEWNYAASGGEEQRVYPWSMPVTSEEVSPEHAAYGQVEGLPSLVGSHPKGDSRWLQSDLGGNVSEWTLDFYADPYPTTDCDNCVNTTAAPRRSLRGGDYLTDPYFLSAADRSNAQPNLRRGNIGFRCARDLKP